MTTRGEIRVKFFNPTTLVSKDVPAPGYLLGQSGSQKVITSKVGNGQVQIAISELAKLTGTYTFPATHDIATVYVMNAGVEEKIGSFVIRSIRLTKAKFGQPSFITLSGPDMLYYLGKKRHYLNIGDEYNTVTADAVTQIGEKYVYLDHGDRENEGMTNVEWPKWTLIKAQSLHSGETEMRFWHDVETAKPAAEQWAVGDDIYIVWQITTQQTFRTSITAIDEGTPGGYYTVTIAEPMEHKADIEEGDHTPEKYYPCFMPHVWKGDPISIQMDNGAWHTTRVSVDARYNGLKLEEGPTDTISIGNAIKWWNAREPNTVDDIDTIIGSAASWTSSSAASSKGSGHFVDPKGSDVLGLLMTTAEATGDHFYAAQSGASTPENSLDWITSSPFTGLTLVEPATYLDGETKRAGGAHAFVHELSQETRDLPITRVVPVGGVNDEVNFDYNIGHAVETPAAGLLARHGITALDTMTKEYVNGVWRIRNASSAVEVEEMFSWGDIMPKSISPSSIIEAAEILQARGALVLHNRREAGNKYNVTTVLPNGHEINVGEKIYLTYNDSEWDISELLYISEYEHFVVPNGDFAGMRQTRMVLSSDAPYARVTGATAVAGALKSARGSGQSGFNIGSGGLGGGPGGANDEPSSPQELVSVAASTPTGALTIDGQELTFLINHTDGLDVSGTTVQMTVPTVDLSVSSTNAVAAGGHTHAIDNTTDGDSNPSTIMAVDSNGRMAVSGLGIGTSPGSDNIIFHQNSDAEGEGWTSGRLGAQWGIDTQLGHIDARSAYFDELHVTLFTADETLVTAGTHWVTPGMGKFSREWTIPAVSSSTTVYLWDSEALPDSPLFRNNSKVMIQVRDTTGAGITLAFVWGTLTSYSDESGNEQSWTFTTGSLGAAVGGNTVPAESVCLGFGLSGQGFHAIETNDLAGSPYTKIATWVNNPWTAGNITEHVRLGNLNGLANLGEEWGLYVGVAPTGPRAVLSDTRFELYDVGLTMYAGTAETAHITLFAVEFNTDVTTAIAPNATISEANTTLVGASRHAAVADDPTVGQPDADWVHNDNGSSGTMWLELENIDDALTEMSVEAYCGISGFTNDFCTLRVQLFKADQTSALTNEIQIINERATAGLVTSWFSDIDTTATQIEWNAARARFRWIYNIGSGAGDEVMTITPSAGMDIIVADSASFSSGRAITYTDSSGNEMAGIYGRYNAGINYLKLVANPIASYESDVALTATGGASLDGYITLRAQEDEGNGTIVSLLLDTADDIANFTAGVVYCGSDLTVLSGAEIGSSAHSPASGQLLLDQGSGDGVILEMLSSDVTGMGGQGMAHANAYGEFLKADGNTGGLVIRGGSESTSALWLIGSADTGTSVGTPTTSTTGPVNISGRVDDTFVGSGNVVMTIRNASSTRWLIAADGEVWNDYATTMSTYDGEDDDIILRQFERVISPSTILERSFDQFVDDNDDALVRLGIIASSGSRFVSQQKLNMLKIGALTQHGNTIREQADTIREQADEIAYLRTEIASIKRLLGFRKNDGTILEN
jgi:hypothetical protein